MPLPKPNSGESKDEFIERCMGDETMNEDFPEEGQRFAVCEAQWDAGEEDASPAAQHDNRRKHGRGIRKALTPASTLTPALTPASTLTPALPLKGEGVRHEPIRCFEGTARPHEAFWAFRNSSDGGNEPEMELYGYISEYSWFDDDITPKMFKDDLWQYGNGGPITIRLNSGGGDVIAASVMKAMLIDYPGKVTVKIDGLAASAATIVAMAGDRVMMQESAYFMIHDPLVSMLFAVLNIEEVSRLLASLKAAKSGILDAYVTKTGLSRDKLGNMMTRETWMSANEAREMGFVDEVITTEDRSAQRTARNFAPAGLADLPNNAALMNALQNYRNVPEALMTLMGSPCAEDSAGEYQAPDVQDQQEAIEAERLRAKVKLLIKE